MITKTKQNWNVGQQVRVGFLTLTVQAALATPGDGMPDVYFLTNQAGDRLYRFTPHFGLERVSIEEAERQMADARRACERIAKAAISKAAKQDAARTAITRIFGGELAPAYLTARRNALAGEDGVCAAVMPIDSAEREDFYRLRDARRMELRADEADFELMARKAANRLQPLGMGPMLPEGL